MRTPLAQRSPRPSVMGVVNVTPDSFSDGGVNLDPAAAITSALPGAPAAITRAVDHNGRQEDLDFRTFNSARVTLREYTLVRLAGHYAITRNVSLTARAENLLDQDYEEVFSYRPSGRAFYAGVQAKF